MYFFPQASVSKDLSASGCFLRMWFSHILRLIAWGESWVHWPSWTSIWVMFIRFIIVIDYDNINSNSNNKPRSLSTKTKQLSFVESSGFVCFNNAWILSCSAQRKVSPIAGWCWMGKHFACQRLRWKHVVDVTTSIVGLSKKFLVPSSVLSGSESCSLFLSLCIGIVPLVLLFYIYIFCNIIS